MKYFPEMIIYSDFSNYHKAHRYQLNAIAKALWNDRSPEERRRVYGDWVDLFTYEPEIEQADVCLLTYQWPYYVNQNKVAQAREEVNAARAHGKPLVIFSGGDHPANLPFEDMLENVILFESAGYRSTPGLRYHSAQPSFIWDYLESYNGGELVLRKKTEFPTIGFCGQASTSPLQTAFRWLRLKRQQLQYRQGGLKWEPPPFETTSFRIRVLKQFENQPGLNTNYLLRSRYHGGDTKAKSLKAENKSAFVDNILDSDYTVCMRGGGNFSLRFYETLCLGRIPIFIDTDCLLPFQDDIDYKAYFPWIDVQDLPHAAEIIRDYHAALSEDDFIDRQRACRALWLDHMTTSGFYRDLAHKLHKLIQEDSPPEGRGAN